MFDSTPPDGTQPRPGPITRLLSGRPPSAVEFDLTVMLALARRTLEHDEARARAARQPRPEGVDPLPDWAEAHPLATELEGLTPGARMVERLTSLDPGTMDDAALVEAVAAWDRVASWASARQAVVLNELRHRREGTGRAEYTGDEVAARLATTRSAGEGRVADAWALEQLPDVWEALAAGRVDARKARVLTEELLAVPEQARAAVAAHVLEVADGRTAAQLRSRIRRAALAVDPDAARQAHVRARRDRHVELHPVHDGMAWIHAFLPAPEATAVHTALTAMADAQGPDDDRPMDARRADALVDAVTRWLDAGTSPDGTPLPSRQRRRPHLAVTASAATLLGLDERPGDLAGYGPISASMAREIAAAATWTPLLLDATTGALTARGNRTYRPSNAQADWIIDRDATCTFPGCRVPAARCDLDHNTPFDHSRPAQDQTVVDLMDPKCRHHHRMKTHGGWRTARDADTGETTWSAPTGHTYQGGLDRTPPPTAPPEPRPDGAASPHDGAISPPETAAPHDSAAPADVTAPPPGTAGPPPPGIGPPPF